MQEQLDIFSNTENECSFDNLRPETKLYKQIEPDMIKVVGTNNAPADSITFTENKSYFTLLYRSNVVFRVHFSKKAGWIEIPKRLRDIAVRHGKQLSGETDSYLKIDVDGVEAACCDLFFYSELLDMQIDLYPTAHSCCSRYVECSNAKCCVNPDKEISMDCYYRKNLKAGKIFFGDDANI
ncbi:MAG: hypothetical protein RR058_08430 [Oscillospiraceae bacterium]